MDIALIIAIASVLIGLAALQNSRKQTAIQTKNMENQIEIVEERQAEKLNDKFDKVHTVITDVKSKSDIHISNINLRLHGIEVKVEKIDGINTQLQVLKNDSGHIRKSMDEINSVLKQNRYDNKKGD